jgi:hypothetical protein
MALPRHYKVLKLKLPDVSKYLDQDYGMGWRVVQMTVLPDGEQLVFLLEKLPKMPNK